MKLEDMDLSKLLPLFMREDKSNTALADTLSELLQPLARQISRLSTWNKLSELSSEQKDELAEELRVHWYDKDLPDEVKTLLLSRSDRVYRILGTKAAIEEVIQEVFSDPAAYVEEWYEYDGRPNFFRIHITDTAQMRPENEARLYQILDIVKRKSQWLDQIQNQISAAIPLYIGLSVGLHTHQKVHFDIWQDHSTGSYRSGCAVVTRQSGPESTPLTQ